MRNDDQRRRGDFSGREFGQGGSREDRERDFGEPDWQGGGYRERGQHRAESSLFQSGQERRNQFERSNYGNMDDDGAGGGWLGRETGYGGYDGEYGDYGARGSRGGGSYRGSDRFGGDASEGQGGRPQRYMPKGYQRSDERIREDVCERLAHSGIDVSEVSVEVAQGHVTLSGTVPERYMKHAIEDCADDCAGVQDVDNRIRVQRGGAGAVSPSAQSSDKAGS